METAKIFENGRSQAVRLPKQFRFDVDEVVVQKLGEAVILVPKEALWQTFMEGLDGFTEDIFDDGRRDNKYDGIIHIKSTFCTPEIGSMSIINKMCEENDMPVLFMSMDINTSKVGIETRLEAFYDMIEMRKNNE